jgi:hypothetical protein
VRRSRTRQRAERCRKPRGLFWGPPQKKPKWQPSRRLPFCPPETSRYHAGTRGREKVRLDLGHFFDTTLRRKACPKNLASQLSRASHVATNLKNTASRFDRALVNLWIGRNSGTSGDFNLTRSAQCLQYVDRGSSSWTKPDVCQVDRRRRRFVRLKANGGGVSAE